MRILAGMKLENRRKKIFHGKKLTSILFFLTARRCRQVKVHKTDILHESKCARFLQIGLQNVSNCTDFSLDFPKFSQGKGGGVGGMPLDVLEISSFFSFY